MVCDNCDIDGTFKEVLEAVDSPCQTRDFELEAEQFGVRWRCHGGDEGNWTFGQGGVECVS